MTTTGTGSGAESKTKPAGKQSGNNYDEIDSLWMKILRKFCAIRDKNGGGVVVGRLGRGGFGLDPRNRTYVLDPRSSAFPALFQAPKYSII
jgi:hypothetical protein